MVVKGHIIAHHVLISHFMQPVAELHIIEGNPQFLLQPAALLIDAAAHHQAGARHAQDVKCQPVAQKIIIVPVVPKLQLMRRAQPYIGNAGMLDGMAFRIQQFVAHRSHMGEGRLLHHPLQPVVLRHFNIIIEQQDIIPLRQGRSPVAHAGEIEFHGFIDIPETAALRHQRKHPLDPFPVLIAASIIDDNDLKIQVAASLQNRMNAGGKHSGIIFGRDNDGHHP